jgi:hypothetical protein
MLKDIQNTKLSNKIPEAYCPKEGYRYSSSRLFI